RHRARLEGELVRRARAHPHRREELHGPPKRGAHAPHEVASRLERFGLGVRGDRADKEAQLVFGDGTPRLRRALSIELEQLPRHLEGNQEGHVGVAHAPRPHRRLRARRARHPDGWVWLLERQAPRVYMTEMIVPPFPPERAGRGPALDDEVVALLEA